MSRQIDDEKSGVREDDVRRDRVLRRMLNTSPKPKAKKEDGGGATARLPKSKKDGKKPDR